MLLNEIVSKLRSYEYGMIHSFKLKKLIPDDYCLLGYLFGPMVCYVTFIICGIYFLGMDDHSDKFQSCMSTLGLSYRNLK